MIGETLKLYTELADWFHLLTRPEDYAEEAEFYRKAILSASSKPPHNLLELGSGGGNNASHLKAHFTLTLVELSPEMIATSRTINPELEHLQGDIVAGFTVALTIMPQSIAYAGLANLPAQV